MSNEDWRHGGFGIYVHWPFCESKCPYCDFNSHVSRNIDHDRWMAAYLQELDRYARLTPGRVVNSVFFGGGTPSLMNPSTTAAVIDKIAANWLIANDVEITLEANPGSVEAQKFRDFRSAGINRVSLGIQALNEHDLRRLGRLHSLKDAYNAMDIALSTFDRSSIDLIYARQDQSLEAWQIELNTALTLGFSHLSLYSLTIENGTAFGDLFSKGKLRGLPDEDLSADMYDLTSELCGKHGLTHYEISNFAAEGEESRHNLIYWSSGDYVGVGPGAHGRVTIEGSGRVSTEGKHAPGRWLEGAFQGDSEHPHILLSSKEHGEEMLLMGLRLLSGIDLTRFEAITGHPLSQAALDELISLGAISHTENRLSVNENWFNLLNQIIAKLATDQ